MGDNIQIPRLPGITTPSKAPPYAEDRVLSRPSSRGSSRLDTYRTNAQQLTTSRVRQASHSYDRYHISNRNANSRYTSRSMPARLTPLGNTPRVAKGGMQTPTKDISSKYARFYETTRTLGCRTPMGFIKRSNSEDCIKCMLKVPHDKCEAHKYLRVGGGYRHSYWYCKALLEEIELQRQREELIQQRLDAIHEKQMKAIKTYIRTKSGRMVEKIVYMSEEDYQAFRRGGKDALDVLKKYLSKDDAKNLHSYEKEEQKAITTWVRTKSGRRVQKTVYVSKEEYDAMKSGQIDAKSVLKKYMKPDELAGLEGWGEAEMKQIKTYVRTKSGKLIEKIIMVTKEDYDKMKELEKQGKDPNEVLNKYMSLNEGEKVEGWKKEEPPPMKVVKAMVRTKSGKLVEKTILMTEEEFKKFQESGGDLNMLKKYMDLDKDDVIEDWEKASTVYEASDDEEIRKVKPGTRVVGKDGQEYEVVVDPLTGKKYKKKIGRKGDTDSGIGSMKGGQKVQGKVGRGKIIGAVHEDPHEKGMTKEQVEAYRTGKRRDDSDSEFSYRSVVSAGGTRKVLRKKKNADGTYGKEEEYDEDADVDGKKRRQQRRQERKAVAIKKKIENLKKGKRDADSDGSEFSYRSVHSAGGTRRVFRRRKHEDGTYSREHSYHSSQDEDGDKRRKKRREKRMEDMRKGKRNPDSDSEYSYRSVVSAGGTRKVMRKKKNADGTYGKEEEYDEKMDKVGKERRRQRREARQKAFKQGKRRDDSDSDFSYRSVVSAGGTRHVKRRRKRADGTYSAEESYHSGQDDEGDARRRRRRRDRKHAGSAHSYYSVESAGGTRRVRRRKKNADGTYAPSESYHSGDSDFYSKDKLKKKKRREHGADSDHSYFSEVSAGGTRTRKRKEKIRDKHGKVIGYKKAEDYSSPSDSDDDVKGGKKGKGKGKKKKGGGPDGNMTDFSEDLQSTDSEAEKKILAKMSKKEKEKYFADKAKRRAVREKKRKEKYGDKYEEMMEKHQKAKEASKKAGKKKKGGGPDGNMTDFSEDLQSTDSEDEPDLTKMTEEEKEKYFEEKAKRKAEREKKRKEKYGDKYEEMVEKHQKNRSRRAKEAKKQARSVVDYAKGPKRFGAGGEMDDRDVGLGHDKWGKKKKKDGHEADDEGDGSDRLKKKKKRITSSGSEVSVESYFEVDEDGKVKLKDGQKKIDLSKLDDEDLRKLGIDVDNMTKEEIARALKEKFGDDIEIIDGGKEFDAGDYFEVGDDGKMKLKDGKKKIDLSKLSEDDLKKMGIDPDNMTKEEIARKLKQMFGDDVEVIDQGNEFDDGDYFEIGKDGKVKLKGGKKKIDLSKLTDEDLKKMGIDPSKMTKEEISRALKEKFGKDLEIIDQGEKFDDGDYFEMGADGKMKLKKGTKKIDLSKMTKEDLKKLGIDTKYMTKEQIAKKLREKFGDDVEVVDGNDSDGDYFEVGEDGKVKLKAGKKKIDITKLTAEDLKKLGIDPEASKEEIAKALKEKFGDDVTVTRGGVKVGLRNVDEFDSDADTDDLAYDSDLDISTLTGEQKVRIMMKRGGGILRDHMEKMIEQSNLDEEDNPDEEKDSAAIDFLKHYKLVDHNKLDMYARAYVVEDEDLDYRIDAKAARSALAGVPTLKHIGEKQVDYVFKLLDLDHENNMNFRMFAVMTALAERVTAMDEYCVELIRVANLTDIERKMALYKAIFYCSSDGDTHPNYIKVDNLKIELMAGGLTWEQQEYLIERMKPNDYREISFLDYLCYIPLFLSMHDGMLDNPLDMSHNKYQPGRAVSAQRDMNPLGYPMKKDSTWIQKQDQKRQAKDILQGKNLDSYKNQGMDVYNKYQKLPHIQGGQSMPPTAGRKPYVSHSKKTKALF